MTVQDALPRIAGLLGHPVGHSVSPALQQAAFDHHGLAVRYHAWDTPPEALAGRLDDLRRPEVIGANVTLPHKQAVIPRLTAVDPEAAFVGAVNTIVNEAGRLVGHNTDIVGFLRALREDAGCEPRGVAAVVLGAGGAARAVAYALVREGVRSLAVANRRPERGRALVDDLAPMAQQTSLGVVAWDERSLACALQGCDLVVNATTIGMWHGPAEHESPPGIGAISPGAVAFDLVYNPPETPFLRIARAAGARATTGLSMLVYQGAESFYLWTGRPAPDAAMHEAARAALQEMRSANA